MYPGGRSIFWREEEKEVKVSVIIPIYNVEKYIEKTIESLQEQTLKDFEVLFINDGSTDDTLRVMKEVLANTNLNYKIIDKENQGVSKTRNLGIASVKGKYTYFLDGDDYIDPSFLEKMYKNCESYNLQVCFCGYTHIKEEDNSVMMNVHKYIEKPMNGLEAAAKMLNNDFWISAISGFYLTSFLIEKKLEFPTDIVFGEDTVFVVKTLMNADTVGCVKEALVYYFRRSSSVTQSSNNKYFSLHQSNLAILQYNRKYFNSSEVERALLEYKIPQSIMRIFSALAKSGNNKKELFEFISKDEIKTYLKGFKINGQKGNIKFKLSSYIIRTCPKMLYGLLQL